MYVCCVVLLLICICSAVSCFSIGSDVLTMLIGIVSIGCLRNVVIDLGLCMAF